MKCAILSEAENIDHIEHDISGPYAFQPLDSLNSSNPSSHFLQQAYSHLSASIIRLSFRVDFSRFKTEHSSTIALGITAASAHDSELQCSAEAWHNDAFDAPCPTFQGPPVIDDSTAFSTLFIQLPSRPFLEAVAGDRRTLNNIFIFLHLQCWDQAHVNSTSMVLACEFQHIHASNEVIVHQITDAALSRKPAVNNTILPLSESFDAHNSGLHRPKPNLSVAIPSFPDPIGGPKTPAWNVSTPLDQRIKTPLNPPPISRLPERKQLARYLGTPTDPMSPADMRHSPTHFGNLPINHITLDAMAAGTPKYLRELEGLPLASPLAASLSYPGFQRSSTPGDYFPRTN
ncbi:hypothetical protein SISSUDRAFT_1039411 [Sistotremastrum suecicum HHB10207 ss-3]|uniref:Uncharacterized protein n=1 Tax=Sistotremastrum suecicum HHB10207 ss-3 TaxID=1314776 RepID=A0A166IW92_9AGAM|nr:hypothetical protein SISSUDRAFT_1039411 [Sistotremastrum suecicum HHB10207 ss-3]